ncbi:MAG: hypothetical protein ACTS4X_01715 [Candidatus Hodgkinia cicadicola]
MVNPWERLQRKRFYLGRLCAQRAQPRCTILSLTGGRLYLIKVSHESRSLVVTPCGAS